MLRESLEAPEAVARQLARNEALCRALGQRLRKAPPRFVATCARGSSDNAATYAKYLIEIRLNTVVASLGPSIRSVYGAQPRLEQALFIAISQSGRSPDLLSLAEVARADGAFTLAIVNDEASPLAARCEAVLPVHAGPEQSVAATKSWIASLSAVMQLVACWSDDPALLSAVRALPDDLAAAARSDWGAAAGMLAGADDLFVVGRGPGFAAAQESALKLKETAGIHAESYSAAELMHGPMTLASRDFPVLALSQRDASLPGMAELIDGLVARGVPVAAAGPAARPGTLVLPMADGLQPFAAPIAAVQSFYPLAERVARMRGHDPDHPPHLRKVTETL
jgi:glucosamine--fructose-6-phosphate aminotransferase (isomerizing)